MFRAVAALVCLFLLEVIFVQSGKSPCVDDLSGSQERALNDSVNDQRLLFMPDKKTYPEAYQMCSLLEMELISYEEDFQSSSDKMAEILDGMTLKEDFTYEFWTLEGGLSSGEGGECGSLIAREDPSDWDFEDSGGIRNCAGFCEMWIIASSADGYYNQSIVSRNCTVPRRYICQHHPL